MPIESLSPNHIDYLQRNNIDLSGLSGNTPSTSAPPDLRRLWRIRGVGRIDKNSMKPLGGGHDRPPIADALIGLYGHKIPLSFLVSGARGEVSMKLGTWSQANRERISATALDGQQDILKAALNSLYPATDLAPEEEVVLNRSPRSGLALGIPTTKPPNSGDGALSIDRLIRAMSGSTWACLVLAEAVDESAIVTLRNSLTYEMRNVEAGTQADKAPSPLAKNYLQLLTAALKALTTGLEIGLWRTGVYLLGETESYYRLSAMWRGIFSGNKSVPEPVRVLDSAEAGVLASNWALPDTPGSPGPGHYRHPLQYQTLLTSNQLAAYVHLPQLETSGFSVRAVPDFDTVPPSIKGDKSVRLGAVVPRTRSLETSASESKDETAYEIGLNDLTRHAFVAGVTGAGKTNTIFYVLKQADVLGVPFLVLEPAKAEYRALLDDASLRGRLQVFTLGNELTAPFRLNPFEVVGWPTVPVGVHLDLLRSVFTASFGMWTPLPQILERCLHAVYEDRGWDITTNSNHRLDSKSDVADAFPTLAEVAAKAEEVIQKLGYESKIADDMRAALVTRLNGLRIGGKGSMLDVQRSLPMKALLDRPTVLELQSMGDDDDKAFLMGLFLIRLYEYRRAEGAVHRLQHLIVIEEAHRLLTNAGPQTSSGEGNPRAKAVETFANLLAEIRDYGQGVIVADQVPVKLAPEVMKNTNLKIVHRVVAADDRTALAGTMAMNAQQAGSLATFRRGQAAVFSEGDDAPILVQVPLVKDLQGQDPPKDKRVKESIAEIVKSNGMLFQPLLPEVDMSDPAAYMARDAARTLADDPTFRRDFVRVVVSITEDDGALDRLWNDLILRTQANLKGGMDERVMWRSLVIYASSWFAHRRGSQEGWSYADTAELEDKLRSVLRAKVENKNALQALKLFRTLMYRLHPRPFEPFIGCAKICTQDPPVCLYRRAVADFIAQSKEDLVGRWKSATRSGVTPAEHLKQTWEFSRCASNDIIEAHPVQTDAIRRIRLCFEQHMLSSQFAEDHERTLRRLLTECNAS